MAIAMSATQMLAGGQEHVHLAWAGAVEISLARAMSSSVVAPRAESTAITWRPSSLALTIRRRGALEPLGVRDRGAAELHDHDPGHDGQR